MNAKGHTYYTGQSLLQSDLWGTFRESCGWRAHRVADTLVLERPLPGGKTFLYSPEVNATPDRLVTLLPEVYAIAARRNSIFYRLELLIEADTPLAARWQTAFRYTPFTKAFECVQPDYRQVVPLGQDDATILSQMKPKGRYNIRVAERAGVLVREATPRTRTTDLDTLYALMVATAKRDKFSIRPKTYFETLSQLLYQHDIGRLFVATHQDEPVAAALVSLYDGVASYLYGASSDHHRHVMGPYAVQWAAMQWSASRDGSVYDLLAIRPPHAKKHHYDGITRFKQQFGGESVALMGSWDLTLQPTWYTLFKTAERLRRRQ